MSKLRGISEMTFLRKAAKDKPCMVRLPGICNFNNATTVLAHVRMPGVSGIGLKSPDLIASWCCSACHDTVDRRANTDLDRDYVRLAHLEGMARTINELAKEGLL
jgi:hypothetical protein